jgi:autotransporter-associated beta strand protein
MMNRRNMLGIATAAALVWAAGPGLATTHTWTQTAGGAQNWEVDGNWSGGTWPTPVSGDTVDFSTVAIATNTTLTLQADRTAEVWKFGDTGNAWDWTIAASNKITLAGTTPTIHVVNRTATLLNGLDGSAGLTKTGSGTLAILSTNNTYSGATTISGGTLKLFVSATLLHRWSFNDGTAKDNVGNAHGTLYGTATIVDNRLSLSGSSENNRMEATLGNALGPNKTLVAWFTLTNAGDNSPDGGPLSVGNTDSPFDSIVYGELTAGQWMNGSDNGNRTPANNGGAGETLSEPNQIMISITYDSTAANKIKIYRNGVLYAEHNKGSLISHAAGVKVLIGPRAWSGWNDGYMNGYVDEARIYSGAISAADIQAMYAAGPNAVVGSLPSSTALSIGSSGATFDLNGASQTIASLSDSGGGGGVVTNSASSTATLTINPSSGSTTFSGAIRGPISLVKTGIATQVLAGASAYAGGTAVSNGTLLVNGSITGAVSVASGATLGGTGAITGNVTFATGALALFTNDVPLTFTGPVTLNNNTVHLTLPDNLADGTYLLATNTTGGFSGMFAAAPVIDSGSTLSANRMISTDASAVRLIVAAVDTFPPTPNPMAFAVNPAALDESTVVMTATTATDALSPPVAYCFTNTVNGNTSGWISSTVWTNTGLTLGTTYGYRVKARDAATPPNETGWSDEATATTSGGGYKMRISFTNYNRAETLTNFPALVVLSNGMGNSGFDFGTFRSTNGYDLRFWNADQTTNLNYEIESWDTNASSFVWVQVANFSSNCYIWATWGDPGQSDRAAYTTNGATWSQGYKGVWHLKESVTDEQTSGFYMDSSPSRINGQQFYTSVGTGIVGRCGYFDGTGDYVAITNPSAYEFEDLVTASIWFKSLPAGWNCAWSTIFHKGHDKNWAMRRNSIYTDALTANTHVNEGPSTISPSPADGNWHNFVFTYSLSPLSLKLYYDGALYYTDPAPTSDLIDQLGAVLRIGANETGTEAFRGLIDEAHLSQSYRSSNWVWASYMTVASNAVFSTAGAVEDLRPQGTLISFF